MKKLHESELAKAIRETKRIRSGITSTIGPRAASSEDSGSGQANDLESLGRYESLLAKKLQVNYTGKVHVRIAFFRNRLADYSRANSEKAIIDCCQYGGIISGDSEREIRLTDEGQFKCEKDQERIELILEYEDVDYDNLWIPAKQNRGR